MERHLFSLTSVPTSKPRACSSTNFSARETSLGFGTCCASTYCRRSGAFTGWTLNIPAHGTGIALIRCTGKLRSRAVFFPMLISTTTVAFRTFRKTFRFFRALRQRWSARRCRILEVKQTPGHMLRHAAGAEGQLVESHRLPEGPVQATTIQSLRP